MVAYLELCTPQYAKCQLVLEEMNIYRVDYISKYYSKTNNGDCNVLNQLQNVAILPRKIQLVVFKINIISLFFNGCDPYKVTRTIILKALNISYRSTITGERKSRVSKENPLSNVWIVRARTVQENTSGRSSETWYKKIEGIRKGFKSFLTIPHANGHK